MTGCFLKIDTYHSTPSANRRTQLELFWLLGKNRFRGRLSREWQRGHIPVFESRPENGGDPGSAGRYMVYAWGVCFGLAH
jgi:hypothetical protein